MNEGPNLKVTVLVEFTAGDYPSHESIVHNVEPTRGTYRNAVMQAAVDVEKLVFG